MTLQEPLQRLSPSDLETLMDWAALEGWNPGLNDAAAFQVADPEGFIGYYENGELVSAIAAVAYDAAFGFIGLYITRADKRGLGYGRRVWDAGMARLENRTVGLDGVPAQQANYRSMGFEKAYGTARWSGVLKPEMLAMKVLADADVAAIDADNAGAVAAFDRRLFPAPRGQFLKSWFGAARSTAVVSNGNIVLGYGAIRACRDGYKIGPLFAETTRIAMTIIDHLIQQTGPVRVDIDIPAMQTTLIEELEALGLTKGFETARMYRGPAPTLHMPGVFAITSLELG